MRSPSSIGHRRSEMMARALARMNGHTKANGLNRNANVERGAVYESSSSGSRC
jgi:hypothetical protein